MVVRGEQDVGRFHVAVHEASAVRSVEGARHLRHDCRRSVGRQCTVAPDEPPRVVARHVPHYEIREAFLLAGVVDRDDVRVLE